MSDTQNSDQKVEHVEHVAEQHVEHAEHVDQPSNNQPSDQTPDNSIHLNDNTDLRMTKVHVTTIVDTIKQVLDGRRLNSSNIIRVTYACVSTARRLQNGNVKVPGALKKKIVLEAMRVYMTQESGLSDDDRELFLLMLDDACDVLVDASKNMKQCCVIV